MEQAKRIGRGDNPAIVSVYPPGGAFAPPATKPQAKAGKPGNRS